MRSVEEDLSLPEGEVSYLDMQAAIGISKHMGGRVASAELHRLCHLVSADEVLEVGCGIGVGPVEIARRYGCRVVAVDRSPQMLHWARERALAAGVQDRVELVQADLSDLPFEANRFDAVLAESVLSFVQDKAAAIAELRRVLRPGGWMGLNETWWVGARPEGVDVEALVGGHVLTREEWASLWAGSGLQERMIVPFAVRAGQETRDRIDWVGWRNVLRAWGRLARLSLAHPALRHTVREMARQPSRWFDCFGYGLLVGQEPAQSASAHHSGKPSGSPPA